MAQQAQDTFVVGFPDGRNITVNKGDVLPDSHEAVALDESGVLFKPLDKSYDEAPAQPKGKAKADPAPAASSK